jgi:hypothetical protein
MNEIECALKNYKNELQKLELERKKPLPKKSLGYRIMACLRRDTSHFYHPNDERYWIVKSRVESLQLILKDINEITSQEGDAR